MGNAIDVTGEKYGRLTALKRLGSGTGGAQWLFACDCGQEKVAAIAQVRAGKALSCGCLRRETAAARNTFDVAGRRVGRLLVIERIGSTRHQAGLWRCVCDCGRETRATTHHIAKGVKQSCGCLQREAAARVRREAALPPEERRARVLANRARQRARRKADPALAMQARISRLHRWALSSVGAIKRSPTLEAVGYTAAELVAHIERQFLPGMGWHNMRDWQIDHIVPISTAKNEQDVVALNQLSNLRPLWAEQNNAKKNRRVLLV